MQFAILDSWLSSDSNLLGLVQTSQSLACLVGLIAFQLEMKRSVQLSFGFGRIPGCNQRHAQVEVVLRRIGRLLDALLKKWNRTRVTSLLVLNPAQSVGNGRQLRHGLFCVLRQSESNIKVSAVNG